MKRFFLYLTVLFWAGAVNAADRGYPALFFVIDVAQDDTLNIRSAPDSGSRILDSYAPDARGIEVTAADETGKWGRVNAGELTGWVSLRFLERHEAGDYAFTRRLDCFGTEPFWALSITDGLRARLSSTDGTDLTLPAGLIQVAQNRRDRYALGLGDDHVAVLRRQECDDGMSDQSYGIDIDLVSQPGGPILRQGCCSLRLDE